VLRSLLLVRPIHLHFHPHWCSRLANDVVETCLAGDADELLRVLRDGGDPNSTCEYENSAVYYAIRQGRTDLLTILLISGANPNVSSAAIEPTLTPLMHALHQSDLAASELLLQFGADPNRGYPLHAPLTVAVAHESVEAVDLLLAHGADVDIRNSEGTTALLLAATCDRQEVFFRLMRHGASLTAANSYGQTAVWNAAAFGRSAVLKALLDRGVSPDTADVAHSTPLMLASKNGHTEAVKLLLAAGATADVKNEKGFTALMMAAWAGHAEVIRVLIQAGADVNLHNKNGYSALSIAAARRGDRDALIDVLFEGNVRKRTIFRMVTSLAGWFTRRLARRMMRAVRPNNRMKLPKREIHP
jgi:ankyrin repeat protein